MPHPRIERTDELHAPPNTAAALGYRMPAEWETQSGVWVVPPHNPETWPGCFESAVEQFSVFVEALRQSAPVRTTVAMKISTNDSWMRDFGPVFVVKEDCWPKELACHDFHFNGWGQKYELRDKDDVVPQYIARLLDISIWVHDFVLEGGSVDVNGKGTVLTTRACLLNPNRNPSLSCAQIEAKLHETLGTTKVIWLPGGIEGDDTNGHIDDVARFVAPDTVVAVSAPQGHPDYTVSQQNLEALRQARDQDGSKIQVIELPAPSPMFYNYPQDRFGPGGRAALPASYANFLISSRSVFVPVFGQASDDVAVRRLELVMPDYQIIPLRAEHLIVGLGAFHCLTMPQPRIGKSEK